MVFSLTGYGLYATTSTLVAAFDFEDLLGAIVPIIFVIIWVVSQVMAASRGAKNKDPQKTLHPTQDEASEAPQNEELVDEIQDFLRRVQRRGQTTEPEEGPPQVVEAEVIDLADVDRVVVKPLRSKATPEEQRENQFATAATTLPDRSGDNVFQVEQRQMEQDPYAIIDHQVGNLSQTPQDSEKTNLSEKRFSDVEDMTEDEQRDVEIPTTAEEIRDLLSRPDGIRKAVILSEVFSRPVDRW